VSALRTKSLFWTFAGVFLVVLAAAAALQAIVALAVLRPLEEADRRSTATRAAERLAQTIGRMPAPPSERELVSVLRDARLPGRDVILAYLGSDGRIVGDRPLLPGMGPRMHELAADAGLDAALRRPPPDGLPPDLRGPPGDGPPPPRGDGPRERGEGPRLELLHHVALGNGRGDAVLAFRSGDPAAAGGAGSGARAWFLFVPIAVLAAGLAGLLMVRVVVRRLRALDRFAERVTQGELTARVETTGADEIGRLEQRLNRMTDALASARDAVATTDRQRRELVANITHELATPLTTIRGSVETLLDPRMATTAEERTSYLTDVLDESKRLELLIADLLDLARLEAGAQPLRPVRLDWVALCRNTVRRLEPRFRDAGLALAWDPGVEEAWIVADGRRMEQVADNLLVNALRHVPAPGTVRVGIVRAPGEPPRYRLTVQDDGPGVPANEIAHIFDRFYRSSLAREAAGSGLGLAIVREIVDQHRGRWSAEAVAPHGVAFRVEIPAALEGARATA
jgi:two-component system sensor histidine kinase BaeS